MRSMQSPRGRDLAVFWFLSVLWSGNWLLIKVGLEGLPPFHFLLAGEPLTARTFVATLAGIAGVAVIEGPAVARAGSLPSGSLALGGLLVLVSAVVSALSAVIVKKRLARVSAVANVWGQSLVAALVLLSAAAVFERGTPSLWTSRTVFALGYLAVVGTFTFLGSQWLIPRLPVAVVGTFPILNTLLALLWGSLFGHERITGRAVAGGVLILSGVVTVTVRTRAPSAAAPAAAG